MRLLRVDGGLFVLAISMREAITSVQYLAMDLFQLSAAGADTVFDAVLCMFHAHGRWNVAKIRPTSLLSWQNLMFGCSKSNREGVESVLLTAICSSISGSSMFGVRQGSL